MPKPIALPPLERLNELFEIVPIAESNFGVQSGLVWKISRQGTKGVGSVAGTKKPDPRKPDRFDWAVEVEGKKYLASRVIYLMASGVDPGEFEIDHEDRNSLNNNVGNLRLFTSSPQQHNRKPPSSNTSGAVGVHWDNGKWRARLWHEGEHFYLGRHTCKIKAAHAYNNKVIELGLDKIGKPLNDLEAIACDCKKHA